MNLPAYLARIGFDAGINFDACVEPTVEVLFAIQRAHLLHVPFENFDIHLGRPIVLDEAALFDKIVTRRRGGFCYELNGLLAAALEEIGFHVVRLSAMAAEDDGGYSPDFDHLALQVHAQDDPETAYLVDVGWGNGPLEPLRMLDMREQRQQNRIFRLRPEGCHLVFEERGGRGLEGEGNASQAEFVRHYRFTLMPRVLADFAGMCSYHQTSPESIFTRKRMATIFTPGGRVTLSGTNLIETTPSGRTERELSPEEVGSVLRERFGLVL